MSPRLSGYACILVVDEVAGDRIMMASDDKDQITIAALLATLGPRLAPWQPEDFLAQLVNDHSAYLSATFPSCLPTIDLSKGTSIPDMMRYLYISLPML